MVLETTLTDITARLRQGKFPNEQAISQGVVLRVFQELGWDTWDTTVVWPEYQTGEGRADFALCHPPSKPAVFTEVKQPGKAEDAVRQALEYAFHAGVPFVVLTDGRTWSFYLPAEQGSYEDRRVYKLDLYERPAAEAGEILLRYLERSRVESGEALEAARKEYRNRRSQAKAAIPEAWRELSIHGVEKTDETRRLCCLCRLNLAVHGLEGEIKHGNINSYYDDPHDATGRFDFVLANPPFNVNAVDKERLNKTNHEPNKPGRGDRALSCSITACWAACKQCELPERRQPPN